MKKVGREGGREGQGEGRRDGGKERGMEGVRRRKEERAEGGWDGMRE